MTSNATRAKKTNDFQVKSLIFVAIWLQSGATDRSDASDMLDLWAFKLGQCPFCPHTLDEIIVAKVCKSGIRLDCAKATCGDEGVWR